MAMISVPPVAVRVGCDPFTGRPRAIRIGGDTIAVLEVERVRAEAAAYPADQGPRTVFTVRTSDSRVVLAFRHRDRRWQLEGVEPHPGLPAAA
jgi:hypothetical protein